VCFFGSFLHKQKRTASLLEKQKKGEQNNTNKKEHTSFGETIPRPVSIGFVQRQAKRR
jgi:hypothetical protein